MMKIAVCGFVLLVLTSSVAGQQCSGCWPGTSGPCKKSDTVCYAYHYDNVCPPGTTPCAGGTPAPATPAPATPAPATPAPTPAPATPAPTPPPAPTPAPAPGGTCTNCWPGTSGKCKGPDTVCWPYAVGTQCPGGTNPCGPAPPPGPTPGPTPAPTPGPTPAPGSIVRGFYWWTWSGSPSIPSDTNLGVAFSGWASTSSAVSDSNGIKNSLPGAKYISLGGGNENGKWTSARLTEARNYINSPGLTGYSGVVFDVEEGDAGLRSAWELTLQAAKNKGLSVLVTISHSAPYGVTDASDLMDLFLSSSYVDYVSPQLYTSGQETANDYTTSGGVPWSRYKTSVAKIVPSIVRKSLYADAQAYFAAAPLGITLSGYIQWAQS